MKVLSTLIIIGLLIFILPLVVAAIREIPLVTPTESCFILTPIEGSKTVNIYSCTVTRNETSSRAPTPVAVAPPSGIVAWWPGDVDASDISGNNYPGTKTGEVRQGTGKVRNGFVFPQTETGENGYITLPSFGDFTTFSVEAWVQKPRTTNMETEGVELEGTSLDSDAEFLQESQYRQTIFSYKGVNADPACGFTLGVLLVKNASAEPSKPALRYPILHGIIEQEDGTKVLRTVLGLKEVSPFFSHLAATYDEESLKLYLNGELLASEEVSGRLAQCDTSSTIGANSLHDQHFFKGSIDELTVYNRALSAEEINTIYNAQRAGKVKTTLPSAPEICDGRDNDQDGQADEDYVCSCISADGLTVWLRGDGNAREIMTGRDLPAVNLSYYISGRAGKAFLFKSEKRSYVELPSDLIPYHVDNSFSYDFWFHKNKLTPLAAQPGILFSHLVGQREGALEEPNSVGHQVSIADDGKLRIFTRFTSMKSNIASENDVRDNKWHHLAVVYDQSTTTVVAYLDGVVLGTVTGNGRISAGSGQRNLLGKGYIYSEDKLDEGWAGRVAGWYPYGGVLDEFHWFNKALSAPEVGALFNARTVCYNVAPNCGDGIVNRVEEFCDDGNNNNTDSCNTQCRPSLACTEEQAIKNLDVAAVVDVSGSMNWVRGRSGEDQPAHPLSRIQQTRRALAGDVNFPSAGFLDRIFAQQNGENNEVLLAVFSDLYTTVHAKASSVQKDGLEAEANAISAGGGTNYATGLLGGITTLCQDESNNCNSDTSDSDAVIFMTDGAPTTCTTCINDASRVAWEPVDNGGETIYRDNINNILYFPSERVYACYKPQDTNYYDYDNFCPMFMKAMLEEIFRESQQYTTKDVRIFTIGFDVSDYSTACTPELLAIAEGISSSTLSDEQVDALLHCPEQILKKVAEFGGGQFYSAETNEGCAENPQSLDCLYGALPQTYADIASTAVCGVVTGCTSDAQCVAGQRCVEGACVARVAPVPPASNLSSREVDLVTQTPGCNDAVCQSYETCASCVEDCNACPAGVDTDSDGIPDTVEEARGLNPASSDSDSDGIRDDRDYCPATDSSYPGFTHVDGLIAVNGCPHGDIAKLTAAGDAQLRPDGCFNDLDVSYIGLLYNPACTPISYGVDASLPAGADADSDGITNQNDYCPRTDTSYPGFTNADGLIGVNGCPHGDMARYTAAGEAELGSDGCFNDLDVSYIGLLYNPACVPLGE